MEEFRYDQVEGTYEHSKKCMEEASGEALGVTEETQHTYDTRWSQSTVEGIKEKKELYNK